ncbi:MAG TPA: hypothetical protein VJX67_06420 [Blastocatellia bacterium]|nr:hypothetical protein [Blastocatellia bacterium]
MSINNPPPLNLSTGVTLPEVQGHTVIDDSATLKSELCDVPCPAKELAVARMVNVVAMHIAVAEMAFVHKHEPRRLEIAVEIVIEEEPV